MREEWAVITSYKHSYFYEVNKSCHQWAQLLIHSCHSADTFLYWSRLWLAAVDHSAHRHLQLIFLKEPESELLNSTKCHPVKALLPLLLSLWSPVISTTADVLFQSTPGCRPLDSVKVWKSTTAKGNDNQPSCCAFSSVMSFCQTQSIKVVRQDVV